MGFWSVKCHDDDIRDEGREEGREKGREEGREEERKNTLDLLIAQGYLTPEEARAFNTDNKLVQSGTDTGNML